jgi:DNA-binding MltR family transcriptional regulator
MQLSPEDFPEFMQLMEENIADMSKGTTAEPLQAVILFRKTLATESDRGCALMAAAFIDEQLKELLSVYLVDDAKVTKRLLGNSGPLGSFSARIDMAYSLGLLAKNIMQDLSLLRKIRNEFAHLSSPMTFEDDAIVSRCLELKSIMVPREFDARSRFCRSMVVTATQIELTKGELQRSSPRVDYDDTHARKELDSFVKFAKDKFNLDLSENV